jgi:FAD-dependent oxidoreductase domain-containing protein 1
MQSYDVVIAGGAVMGASLAFWLTRMQPGLRVLVVERDPGFTHASTALSVASIRMQFSTPTNVAISRFGIDFIRQFADRLGQPEAGDLGLIENGYLFLARSVDGAETLRAMAAMQRGLGADTQVLDARAVAARFPWMTTDDIQAATFGGRDEGWFDNMGLLNGFRLAARAQGAQFITDEVQGLTVQAGRVVTAHLAKSGPVACGALANAAGTRAAVVAGWAGIDLPVEPRKRTVFVIDAPNARHPDAPLLIDGGYYLRPERGHWITATVPEDDGPCDVNDFDPDLHLFEDQIWPALYARAPGFDAVKVVRHWVGHYAYNAFDQNALLGPLPQVPNLYFLNGFSGHGLQQSPAVGRGLAEHILTGGWQSLDLSDLSVTRLLDNRRVLETEVV